MRLAKSGAFRMKRPERKGKKRGTAAPRNPGAKKERRIAAAGKAHEEQAFEEDAMEWMVPDVLWNKEDEVVIHYYDIADAAREGGKRAELTLIV